MNDRSEDIGVDRLLNTEYFYYVKYHEILWGLQVDKHHRFVEFDVRQNQRSIHIIFMRPPFVLHNLSKLKLRIKMRNKRQWNLFTEFEAKEETLFPRIIIE